MVIAFGAGVIDLEQPTLLLPVPELARALSRIHRWNGNSPITVAQHAVMASYLSLTCPREALLHDAAEALMGDIATPIKQLAPELVALEERVLERIFRARGLAWPLPPEVKRVDARLAATEGRDFFGLQRGQPYPFPILPWGPETAYRRFLERAEELGV